MSEIPVGSICAVELRCSKCRTMLGGVFHIADGNVLRAWVRGRTSIPAHSAIGDAIANAWAYSTPGTRGDRWGQWGWRADYWYFDQPATFESGGCGRCDCYHELTPLDWKEVQSAIARRTTSLRL
ncbi:MAG: hypothetical protein ABMA25_02375 [Ilumatobacteraceae bacterium]